MKKIISISLLAIFLGSCTTIPKYLPTPDKVGVNEHGSYIVVTHQTTDKIFGELIHIDGDRMIVLVDKNKQCVTVPIDQVKFYSVKYAKSKSHGWKVPLLGMMSPVIFTITSTVALPAVLAMATIGVTFSEENTYTYNDTTLSYAHLKMFARFPQGLPQGLDLAKLK